LKDSCRTPGVSPQRATARVTSVGGVRSESEQATGHRSRGNPTSDLSPEDTERAEENPACCGFGFAPLCVLHVLFVENFKYRYNSNEDRSRGDTHEPSGTAGANQHRSEHLFRKAMHSGTPHLGLAHS